MSAKLRALIGVSVACFSASLAVACIWTNPIDQLCHSNETSCGGSHCKAACFKCCSRFNAPDPVTFIPPPSYAACLTTYCGPIGIERSCQTGTTPGEGEQ